MPVTNLRKSNNAISIGKFCRSQTTHFRMFRISTLKTLFLVPFFSLPVAALQSAELPEVQLKNTIEAVIEVLYKVDDSVSLEKKRAELLTVLDQSFSFDVIIRRTLGRNWERLSPDQQNRIVTLATDLLIHSYTREFTTGTKPTVAFQKPLELSKNKIEIASVLSLDNNNINLTYRLAKLESGWQVYDLIVEGVSLVSNYRKQFDAHFQKKNGDELIDQLEAKLDAL